MSSGEANVDLRKLETFSTQISLYVTITTRYNLMVGKINGNSRSFFRTGCDERGVGNVLHVSSLLENELPVGLTEDGHTLDRMRNLFMVDRQRPRSSVIFFLMRKIIGRKRSMFVCLCVSAVRLCVCHAFWVSDMDTADVNSFGGFRWYIRFCATIAYFGVSHTGQPQCRKLHVHDIVPVVMLQTFLTLGTTKSVTSKFLKQNVHRKNILVFQY